MKSRSAQISVAVVCIVLGILLAVQYKSANDYNKNLPTDRVEDLAMKLDTVTEERDVLAKEVVSLREKLSDSSNGSPNTAGLQEELQKANMLAGLSPLKGPGVLVIMDDSTRALKANEDPNDLLVHDVDVLMIVNELKSSGAEAISINDERVIAMSEIRCAGTTILVNSNKIAAPFKITALGDPEGLESGLNLKGGYMTNLKFYGIKSQITKSDSLVVPAYTGSFKFKWSSLAESTEGVQ